MNTKNESKDKNLEPSQNDNVTQNPTQSKLNILENEIEIIEEASLKYKLESENLRIYVNELNNQILNLEEKNFSQKNQIDQFNLDNEEVEFLKMNLYYGHKCRRSFFNSKGFSVGSSKYRKCVMNKGRKN